MMTTRGYIVHEACREGRDFLLQYGSLEEAWDACTCIEWMFWCLIELEQYQVLRDFIIRCIGDKPPYNEVLDNLDLDNLTERYPTDDLHEFALVLRYRYSSPYYRMITVAENCGVKMEQMISWLHEVNPFVGDELKKGVTS